MSGYKSMGRRGTTWPRFWHDVDFQGFKAYLKRFMIADTALCDYCRIADDDAMRM